MLVLPGRVDLRHLLPPIRDQGQRNTCLAFAVTAAHEMFRATGANVTEKLSEEYLYWACKQFDNNPNPGSTFPSAAAALQQRGQPLDSLWSYDGNRDDTAHSYTPPPIDSDACYKARLKRVKSTIEEIKKHLVANRPVVVSIQLSSGFGSTTDGIIPVPKAGETLTDYHAVLVVGYDDSVANGSLIFRNSWGEDWGGDGYGYLPYRYIQQHGAKACIIEPL